MPKYIATLRLVVTQVVEVEAASIGLAREKIEGDDNDVFVISEHDGDSEIVPGTLQEK